MYKLTIEEHFERGKSLITAKFTSLEPTIYPYTFRDTQYTFADFKPALENTKLHYLQLTQRFLHLYLLSVAELLSFWLSFEGGVTVRTSFKVDPTTINFAPLHKCDCRSVASSFFISPV